MAYTTLDNLKKYMTENIIIQLTDDRDIKEVDEVVVEDAIDTADKLIDSFLNGRYPSDITETADIPAQITDISTKLTAYNLYRRRMQTTLPEAIVRDYKLVLKMLEGIQKGTISPFPVDVEPTVIKTNKTAASKTYNTDVWGLY